jgi:hypothetical protein
LQIQDFSVRRRKTELNGQKNESNCKEGRED